MSDTKENNEESGNEDAAVALDEGQLPKSNAQVEETQDSPHSVSVPIEETPILAENETETTTTTSTPSVSDDNKVIESQSIPDQPTHDDLVKPNIQPTSDVKTEDNDLPPQTNADASHTDTAEPALADAKTETYQVSDTKTDIVLPTTTTHNEPTTPHVGPSDSDIKPQFENGRELENKANEKGSTTPLNNGKSYSKPTFLLDDDHMSQGSESGTEEDQSAFMKELENFFRERSMEFKPPKFYGEGLNCLKLWRAVTRLGGYDKVTSCKLWRQVGESFKPPKTCTTVSWTFRGFYEKALLDYERHKTHGGELSVPIASHSEPMNIETQASGSGRARRDAAARAMQGWHSQRLLGNGEVSDPIIKDKNSISMQKREKQLKNIGLLKRKKPSYIEHTVKAARTKASKPQLDSTVVDIGAPADWVKINVQKTKDCFEVYALVPGLLREEVRVQSDPAGRLVISGEPEHPDNPWGVTPFKKVVSLPSRIDPHQTSAVVTLHGQLFVRVPFELSE